MSLKALKNKVITPKKIKEKKDTKSENSDPKPSKLKAINTPPITACFPTSKATKKQLTLPEYSTTKTSKNLAANRRNTRNSKKQDEEEDSGEDINIETTDTTASTHNCIHPCPQPIEKEQFYALSTEEQADTFLDTLNKLAGK